MTISFSARIANITGHEAGAPYRIAVRVYAHPDEDPNGQFIAECEVTDAAAGRGEDEYDPTEGDVERVLDEAGWAMKSQTWDRCDYPGEEWVADVTSADWEAIVRDTTDRRDRAEQAAESAYEAWLLLIKQAKLANEAGESPTGATAIGKAAGIVRERVYQIRDDRR